MNRSGAGDHRTLPRRDCRRQPNFYQAEKRLTQEGVGRGASKKTPTTQAYTSRMTATPSVDHTPRMVLSAAPTSILQGFRLAARLPSAQGQSRSPIRAIAGWLLAPHTHTHTHTHARTHITLHTLAHAHTHAHAHTPWDDLSRALTAAHSPISLAGVPAAAGSTRRLGRSIRTPRARPSTPTRPHACHTHVCWLAPCTLAQPHGLSTLGQLSTRAAAARCRRGPPRGQVWS